MFVRKSFGKTNKYEFVKLLLLLMFLRERQVVAPSSLASHWLFTGACPTHCHTGTRINSLSKSRLQCKSQAAAERCGVNVIIDRPHSEPAGIHFGKKTKQKKNFAVWDTEALCGMRSRAAFKEVYDFGKCRAAGLDGRVYNN